MSLGELLRIAFRYTLSAGRGHLSVFMAGVSIGGLVLATGLLLTVLSVMNGFEREMRDRILALVPHVTVHTPPDGGRGYDVEARLDTLPGIRSRQAFVAFEGMLVRGAEATAVAGLGLDSLPLATADASLAAKVPDEGVALGDSVAERLGAREGDTLMLLVPPSGDFQAGRILSQRLRLSGIVDTGTELDESLALLSKETAASIAGIPGGISGWRLHFEDPFSVDALLPQLRLVLPPGSYATTWRMTHGNLYAAIQLSRDLVVILLTSIIGVAAFNVVSALVLIVIDQRGSIAILRTLGATPGAMARLFVAQGLIIGVIGSAAGCALGVLLCRALPWLVATLEDRLGFRFLSTDVYPVSFIPVDLRAGDALLIAAIAVLMCVLAALYPALRAARLAPATVLHQDG